MFLYKILLVLLIITFSFAENSEFSFALDNDEILIGKEQLQVYYNNLSEEGSMDIKLILDNGKEYILSTMICRVDKGQFNWTPPDSIPEDSTGHFEFVINVAGTSFEGHSDTIKFVKTFSTTTISSETPLPTNGNFTENLNNTISNIQTTQNTFGNENNANFNKAALDNIEENKKDANSESPFEYKYIYYISGGTGIVVVALTGFFIFYKKHKRSPNDYNFDSRPYNNTSMDVSQILNNKPLLNAGALSPMNVMGSPAYNNNNSMNMNMSVNNNSHMMYNNNNNYNSRASGSNGSSRSNTMSMSYRVPNIDSPGMAPSPAMSLSQYNNNNNNSMNYNNNGSMNNTNYGFYNSPSMKAKNTTFANQKHNNYEMMNNNNMDMNENNNDNNYQPNNIINVNGHSDNSCLTIDVQAATNTRNNQMPNSECYSATPRNGSLPRNKVPMMEVTPTSESPKDGKYNNYRSSILSYISSNRGSFYGPAQAEHSINHELLNQICTVAYASQPENEDELYLCVGDKVKILEVYDDGWAYSLHISSGLEGMLPLNCTAEYY